MPYDYHSSGPRRKITLLPTIVLTKLEKGFKKHNLNMEKWFTPISSLYKQNVGNTKFVFRDRKTNTSIFKLSPFFLFFFSPQINYLDFLQLDNVSRALELFPESQKYCRVIVYFHRRETMHPSRPPLQNHRDPTCSKVLQSWFPLCAHSTQDEVRCEFTQTILYQSFPHSY